MPTEQWFLVGGLSIIALVGLVLAVGSLWEGRSEARPANHSSAPPKPVELGQPPKPTVPPTTPTTVLRAAMAKSDESPLAWAERINQLIKPSFMLHSTSGSHIQVQFLFSTTGFTEICWQAFGENYYPRVNCFRDGVLVFSENGRRGSMGDYLEPGMRYRFRFEVCSDSASGARPVHDIERYILVPTKQMLLAKVGDDIADVTKGVCGVDLSDPDALQAAVESFFNKKN